MLDWISYLIKEGQVAPITRPQINNIYVASNTVKPPNNEQTQDPAYGPL